VRVAWDRNVATDVSFGIMEELLSACPDLEALIQTAVGHVLGTGGFDSDEEFMECGHVMIRLHDMVPSPWRQQILALPRVANRRCCFVCCCFPFGSLFVAHRTAHVRQGPILARRGVCPRR